ncbi:hypothetical protein [Quadrisphaera setariae]|uniref:Dolichyl-phosphate-mannose-protein mannosyltransferase n=1 Tax=Quadrisphaera setariae TaxID=2593304 RepID=A0A5C8ZDF8_9ACTN|nr:hypothetical protein [Quadrisphaera setariae]TXR56135.1 hypothetical protein FMM08_11950 [Quadrisphaera setariae]
MTVTRAHDDASDALREEPPLKAALTRWGPLALVLALQALLSLRLQATAFQDEALYLVYGHWYLDLAAGSAPAIQSSPETWMSGAPQLYPVLAGALDAVGGLSLARAASTACLLAATAATWWTARMLFSAKTEKTGPPGVASGVIAAAAFAGSGSVLFVGHFATQDALAVAVLAWALACGVRAARGRSHALRWAVLAGALLAAASFVKYSAATDAPFVLLAVVLSGAADRRDRPDRWRRSVRAGVVAAAAAAAGVAVPLLLGAGPLLQGVLSTTVARDSLRPAATGELLGVVMAGGGPVLLLGLVGAALLARHQPALAAVLAAGSLAAPLYQVSTGESVSLGKTVVLGALFAAPLVGHLGSRLALRPAGAALVAVGLVAAGVQGAAASARMFSAWPDTTRVVDVLRPVVERHPGEPVAADTPEPLQYGLLDETGPTQWTATWPGSFLYDGQQDLPAFEAALRDGHFAVVVLDGVSSTIGAQLATAVPDSGYQRVDEVTSPDGQRTWTVWERRT